MTHSFAATRRMYRAGALSLALSLLGCTDVSPASQPAEASETDDAAQQANEGADATSMPRPPRSDVTPSAGAPAIPAGRRAIATGLVVDTDQGQVRGKEAGSTRAFLGIPFAKAPAGALRWRPPEPPTARTGVFDAQKYGPICPQEVPVLGMDGRSQEDCLRLNIWAPRSAPAAALPVMVWIHGGSFTLGSGGDQYDGQQLASSGGAIIVTVNYRLGALGFIAHEKLTAESGTSGNYGIMDQREALAWVRRNISAFGGDPENVTIFGESAGGNSVCVHLLSPPSRGLFQKAIAQSGLCMKGAATLKEAEAGGARLAQDLGCDKATDVLACMRAAPARTVLEKSRAKGPALGGTFYTDYANEHFLQPIADGTVLPDQMPRLFEKGAINAVPVLHGSNADEGAMFHSSFMGGKIVQNEAQFRSAVAVRYPKFVDQIVAHYAPPKFPTWNDALARATGDAFFVCAARRMSQKLHAHDVPSYLYRFNGTLDSLLFLDVSGRALHSAELPYLFATPNPVGSIPAAFRGIATIMPGYWLRFAKSADPNGASAPHWPPFDPASSDEFTFDKTTSVKPTVPAECALWDEVTDASL